MPFDWTPPNAPDWSFPHTVTVYTADYPSGIRAGLTRVDSATGTDYPAKVETAAGATENEQPPAGVATVGDRVTIFFHLDPALRPAALVQNQRIDWRGKSYFAVGDGEEAGEDCWVVTATREV